MACVVVAAGTPHERTIHGDPDGIHVISWKDRRVRAALRNGRRHVTQLNQTDASALVKAIGAGEEF